MTDSKSHPEKWRQIVAETIYYYDRLPERSAEREAFFRLEFEQIRKKFGTTYQEIIAHLSQKDSYDACQALLTAISWKIYQHEPMTPIELGLMGVYGLNTEVNNGGFHQYFFNSAGDDWPFVLWMLEEAQDKPGFQRFKQVLSIFPGGHPATIRKQRWRQLEELEKWPWRSWLSERHFDKHSKSYYAEQYPKNELFWRLVKERLPLVEFQLPGL